PICCKPLAASNGFCAEVIDGAEEFSDYLARVARDHFAILIQPFVRAPEHRVFVLNGRALFSYTKTSPSLRADGQSTLAQLVAALPREREAPPLKPRGRDTRGMKVSAGDIPEANTLVTLEGPANRAAGGGSTAFKDGAPPALARIATAAADAVGLNLAAVDVFGEDEALTVIEVNSNPMIATLEEHDRWDLIIEIWRANFAAALR
ncbi:MAG: hypothetical protein ABUS57_21070, partial [Pseudomonadota bacterium]